MRIAGFICLTWLLAFLLAAAAHLHPVGIPPGNPAVLAQVGSTTGVPTLPTTMDDYFLRFGQAETGSNNIVTSVVFDYRGLDTMGEAAVLFLTVASITMLLIPGLRPESDRPPDPEAGRGESLVVRLAVALVYPAILVFGAYVVVHGHLSPGGGFQGGAVMASATALALVAQRLGRAPGVIRGWLAIFESAGLVAFVGLGLAGLGTAFLRNFLAARPDLPLGRTVALGPNGGELLSGGILPLLNISVGLEVFCGLSIILVLLVQVSGFGCREDSGQ